MNSENISCDDRVSLHLADRALSPVFSSAGLDIPTNQSRLLDLEILAQASALSSLTSTAVTAYDISLRIGAGTPLSVMVETNLSGPMLLSSYINPSHTNKSELMMNLPLNVTNHDFKNPELPPDPEASGISKKAKNNNGESKAINDQNAKVDVKRINAITLSPPLLIASAVTISSTEAGEANKQIKKLIKVGQECQRAWIKEHLETSTLGTQKDQ